MPSCDWLWPYGYKYNEGDLPDHPVNLEDFNTEFDDYNATAPSLGWLIPFCFSTNRNSQGGEFDVIYRPMNVHFSKETGKLKVTNEYGNWGTFSEDYRVIQNAVSLIKTNGNELGPNLLTEYTLTGFRFTLLWASDSGGDFDIYYTSDLEDPGFSEPSPVRYLNSASNDLYPALDTVNGQFYFCSDRENGSYDLFYRELSGGSRDLLQILSDTAHVEIIRDTILSGPGEDKCPFILGDLLVFASDREEGFGGFDLYYSIRGNGAWGPPVNFGGSVNTEADEYRPVLIDEGVTPDEIMMVFSSNREGGMGGFDLWFAGIRP